ncbi:MAG TPA: hypothetical protein VF852_17940 [Pseudolabrys sp.]
MATRGRSVTLMLNTHEQKMKSLHDILTKVGGILGCEGCGRMALLHIDVVGDPQPDLAKLGVNSMQINE